MKTFQPGEVGVELSRSAQAPGATSDPLSDV